MEWIENQEICYEDEPIRLSPEQVHRLPPKEYKKMRELAFGSPFSHTNDAQIFYLQARYMEEFEDDCPYDGEVIHYYPTYQSLSTPELRGYFTWRTRLRHGNLEKTSLTYAYLYIYELLHQIGSQTKEEGLTALLCFYEQYGALDPHILRHTRQWIADYAIYYYLPVESVRDFVNADFDEALLSLSHCDIIDDEALFPAILRLSSYRLDRSISYRQSPEELAQVICAAYRRLNDRYAMRYERPYSQKLYRNPTLKARYFPFYAAVFYDQRKIGHYEYRVSPLQRYLCEKNRWSVEKEYAAPQPNKELGTFVRTADRLWREKQGLRPALKPGDENKTIIKLLSESIKKVRKPAPLRVEFDLSRLPDIRRSSEAVGQALMTEEERYTETGTSVAAGAESCSKTISSTTAKAECAAGANTSALPAVEHRPEIERSAISAKSSAAPACPLSGDELRFLQLLLYGGNIESFLMETHRMPSLLAESVNEQLYDEFADTVIEFDGNTPILVEDYREDLKVMIPK
ncbi:MAG: TerB N-terminal domain-containing protein [Lachnospiraceae bacterium]|nr:TerB N-terminal domain-containing protein [Lachnospiraceae bacterium]